MKKAKFTVLGFLLGQALSILVWFAEQTTGQVALPLMVSFPIGWGIGGYLYARWAC